MPLQIGCVCNQICQSLEEGAESDARSVIPILPLMTSRTQTAGHKMTALMVVSRPNFDKKTEKSTEKLLCVYMYTFKKKIGIDVQAINAI